MSAVRQHWEQHACLIPAHDIEGLPSSDMSASVYSAKNEGQPAYVLLAIHAVGFASDCKWTPESARHVAACLIAAADAAESALEAV